MPLVFDKPIKLLQDCTILDVDCPAKDKAQSLLSHFDVKFISEKGKSKHYPLDDLAVDEEELPEKVQTIAESLWYTLSHHLQTAIDGLDTKPEVGTKVGVVYTTVSNRFGSNYGKEEVLPYLFIYKSEKGLELMSEINFGIEVY